MAKGGHQPSFSEGAHLLLFINPSFLEGCPPLTFYQPIFLEGAHLSLVDESEKWAWHVFGLMQIQKNAEFV